MIAVSLEMSDEPKMCSDEMSVFIGIYGRFHGLDN